MRESMREKVARRASIGRAVQTKTNAMMDGGGGTPQTMDGCRWTGLYRRDGCAESGLFYRSDPISQAVIVCFTRCAGQKPIAALAMRRVGGGRENPMQPTR